MRIARFTHKGDGPRLGIVDGEQVVDFTRVGAGMSSDLLDYLYGAPASWDSIRRVMLQGAPALPLAQITLLAPVPRPRKFLALGANYASHLREIQHLDIKLPPHQIWVNKQVSCINDPMGDVVIPPISNTVDFEGELALVIGRGGRHLTRNSAEQSVAGYVVCNDLSVREWQMRTPTMTLGKSFDTHGPIGPWLVTSDEITDPHNLRIRTWVNGELRQDGNTAEMIYRIEEQLIELSTVFTLEPGDIISTGTPAGVGGAMRPPKYLQPGDVVRVEIDHIGALENRLVAAR
jgi:2-keto-4-pentenoate hydratase/2-oxohepta-3-ene-1,7-dioic acid hydratase in catechol pathway